MKCVNNNKKIEDLGIDKIGFYWLIFCHTIICLSMKKGNLLIPCYNYKYIFIVYFSNNKHF